MSDLARLRLIWEPRMLSISRIMLGLLFLEHGTAKVFDFPHLQNHQPWALARWAPRFSGRDPAREGDLGPCEPDGARGHFPISSRGALFRAGDGNVTCAGPRIIRHRALETSPNEVASAAGSRATGYDGHLYSCHA